MSSMKIIQTIKRELKSRGVSYRDVGLHLKMTEAGVKKLLSKDDISFNKLKLICDLMQTSPEEVIRSANESETESHSFSEKQVKFFLSNRPYFHFFMKLAYEQKTPKAIQEEFNLSLRSLNLYLKKLEELGLIKRHPLDRMQIVGGIPLAISTIGTELEQEKYLIAAEQLKVLKTKNSDALKGAGLFLTDSEEEQFLEKIIETLTAFSVTSRVNRKKSNPKAHDCSFLSYLYEGSMFNKIQDLQ